VPCRGRACCANPGRAGLSAPVLLLCFALVLLAAVLLSGLAHRTILSTAVLFLAAGFALGPDTLRVLDLHAESPIVATLAELALFAVLFSDGMRVGWGQRKGLRRTGRRRNGRRSKCDPGALVSQRMVPEGR
jgi:hypothetical protein